ncbi:DsrE family protein [Limimaricola litoreus]|uniref:DsrE family protein n=1 Tax=Limimaricola litoreus TaxID=2955316 RepID=A0A9X2JMT1_9RHOB|nr:DsrE family protein [Limimaricola litoreus]MCP1167652.1 DsrE family protein [Limimaricola litoreus]
MPMAEGASTAPCKKAAGLIADIRATPSVRALRIASLTQPDGREAASARLFWRKHQSKKKTIMAAVAAQFTKPVLSLGLALGLAMVPGLASAQSETGSASQPEGVTPVIEGFGRIVDAPGATLQPSAEELHQIVFSVSSDKTMPDGANANLWRTARAVNVYGLAGVEQENRDFIVIVHGGATEAIMSDEASRAANGEANPNLELIAALQDAGVQIMVCSQAAASHGVDETMLAPGVQMTLSALSAIPVLQSQGYSLMPM